MSSSDSGSGMDDCPWVPYSERQEWKDVTPLEQDDGPDPIVKIAYSDKFRDVYNYFRAIYASREVSERALTVTTDAGELNPANYTVWHHRRFLLKALTEDKANSKRNERNRDLADELVYMRRVIEKHPKNYQVWQHRRAIVEWIGEPGSEIRFCEIMLSQDAKNYHAWQHRQWVIETFNLYDGEIEYIDRLLDEDVRNNSAWNQRFFIITKTAPEGQFKGDILQREVKYTMEAIKKVPANESAWNYLRGLIDRCEDEEAPSLRDTVLDFCRTLYHEKGIRASYLLAAMVDLHADKIEAMGKDDDVIRKEELRQAKELCCALANEHDTIRQEYWTYFDRDLTIRFGGLEDHKA